MSESLSYMLYLLVSMLRLNKIRSEPIAIWSMKAFEALGIAGLSRAYHSRVTAVWSGPVVLLDGVISPDDWRVYKAHLCRSGVGPSEIIWVKGENILTAILADPRLRGRLRAECKLGRKLCFYVGSGLEEKFLAALGLDWSHTLNEPYHPVMGNKPALRTFASREGMGHLMPRCHVFSVTGSTWPHLDVINAIRAFTSGWAPGRQVVIKVEGGEGGAWCTGGFDPAWVDMILAPGEFIESFTSLVSLAAREGRRILLEEWLDHDEWLDVSIMFDGLEPVYPTIQLLDPEHNKDHQGNVVATGVHMLAPGVFEKLRDAAMELVAAAQKCYTSHGTQIPLRGRFGVDALYSVKTGEVRILEVNPRWSASRMPWMFAKTLRARFNRPVCVIMENISGIEDDLGTIIGGMERESLVLTDGLGSVLTAPLLLPDCRKLTVLTAGSNLKDAEERHDALRALLGKPPRFSGKTGSGKHRAIAAA